MKITLINLFTAVILCTISVIIMHYYYNEASGIWDETITLIASWETFAIIVMWKPMKQFEIDDTTEQAWRAGYLQGLAKAESRCDGGVNDQTI